MGLIAFGNDFLSPFLNLGWLALALGSGWLLGKRWGVAPLTLAAVAVVCSLSVFSTTQPGETFNDIVGLAMLLAGVALLSGRDRGELELVAAGTALGLAVGTKYTFVVPAVVVLIGTPFLSGERRLRAVGWFWRR